MYYDVKVSRVQAFEFSVEAKSNKEAERLALERFNKFDATAEDVTVQSKAVAMEITKPLSNGEFMRRLVR